MGQVPVGGHQREAVNLRGGGEEPVCRVAMGKLDAGRLERHLVGERGLAKRRGGQGLLDSGDGATGERNPPLLAKNQSFPHAHRRQPEFVAGLLQFPRDLPRKPLRFQQASQPDVRVEQQSHGRKASQSSSPEAGETMSPVICPVPARAPSQPEGRSGVEGGTTSATGTPKRVTNTGLRVLRTRSRTAKQVALKLEMAICSMARSRCHPNTPSRLRATPLHGGYNGKLSCRNSLAEIFLFPEPPPWPLP